MAWHDIWQRIFGKKTGAQRPPTPPPLTQPPHEDKVPHAPLPNTSGPNTSGPNIWGPQSPQLGEGEIVIRRHFYNKAGFQTYGSFFSHWGGWLTAGHVITGASGHIPPFTNGSIENWPDGLDACAIGCTLPAQPPKAPYAGQAILIKGYPAGSRHLETRRGRSYFEREPGVWIAHILTPDEPVVSGMSGGVVIDEQTQMAIGILITRNSPADLNADRDPDESADFVALTDIWHALKTLEEEGPLLTS